jgi:DNA invertase Pin-like site-specific DNA recombinase
MLIGYAHVSTEYQETAAQIAVHKTAGCGLIFQEKASGSRWDWPELHRLLGQLRKDDLLVAWKLNRLSRRYAIHFIQFLQSQNQVGTLYNSIL